MKGEIKLPTLETIFESKDEYWFQLKINEKMRVEIDTSLLDGIWKWSYFCFIEDHGENHFETKDKVFLPINLSESLSKEISEKINNAFYELIRQMKTHPSYRLKVIHVLNDELREIWDTI